MTVVSANAARPIGADSFRDLAGLEDVAATVAVSAGKVVVTFDAELTDAQTAAVRDRMESRDDADQDRRATLRAAAAGHAINLAELNTAYLLGDPLPAPTYLNADVAPVAALAKKTRTK